MSARTLFPNGSTSIADMENDSRPLEPLPSATLNNRGQAACLPYGTGGADFLAVRLEGDFVFRAAGFLVFAFGVFLAAALDGALRAAFLRVNRRPGPWAARAASNARACSKVSCSGSDPRGSEAFVVPSVTYGP